MGFAPILGSELIQWSNMVFGIAWGLAFLDQVEANLESICGSYCHPKSNS